MLCTHLPKTISYEHKQNAHTQIRRKRPQYRQFPVGHYPPSPAEASRYVPKIFFLIFKTPYT